MPDALIIEDNEASLYAIAELVERQGFSTATARSLADAREELSRHLPHAVLLDVFLPDGSGFDLLLDIPQERRPRIILMSGDEATKRAVSQMPLRDMLFLKKPIEAEDVSAALGAVRRECRGQASRREDRAGLGRLLGRSAAMVELRKLVEKVAPTDCSVYIEGESGTGKELVALEIHDRSKRAKQPFVALNCGALPESLIDAELFGHERGAFTGAASAKPGVFEQADGGTLFLDEVAEMPTELQVRLLRVLETGQVKRVGGTREIDVDVRVLAATNRSAERAIADGKLREDLYHRLGVFPIHTPPLRQRPDDIEDLVEHFLAAHAETEGVRKDLAAESLAALQRYTWPGNVRQLKNAVHRAYIMADGAITVAALPPQVTQSAPSASAPGAGASSAGASSAGEQGTSDAVIVEPGSPIADVERRLIMATLAKFGQDKQAAADALGISLRTLYNRLKDYEAEPPGA